MKKDTGDLRDELLSQPHLDEYLKENGDQFVSWGLTEQLMRLFDEKMFQRRRWPGTAA